MNKINIIKDICAYYSKLHCTDCPFNEYTCMLEKMPDEWDVERLNKICKAWEDEWITLGEMLHFFCPGIDNFKKNICPDILEPKFVKQYNCNKGNCDECWKKFLGQKIRKDAIRKLLDD